MDIMMLNSETFGATDESYHIFYFDKTQKILWHFDFKVQAHNCNN